ncbi:MAG: hypothetical protein CVV34_02190 [Methanomicrobiales archaeon HGW-Methanomicrobiales-5]|nr:MAG: hypothetical protein CVV34_02190 [Methanomicrobiales archaeon HGW-Methanomicrobiales-5]
MEIAFPVHTGKGVDYGENAVKKGDQNHLPGTCGDHPVLQSCQITCTGFMYSKNRSDREHLWAIRKNRI